MANFPFKAPPPLPQFECDETDRLHYYTISSFLSLSLSLCIFSFHPPLAIPVLSFSRSCYVLWQR